ncbi:MAG: hypothetical protein Q3999_00820 [Buchananella hordeovulneris]|nr:hypothetical protein [Buchananella hordeovulneris]
MAIRRISGDWAAERLTTAPGETFLRINVSPSLGVGATVSTDLPPEVFRNQAQARGQLNVPLRVLAEAGQVGVIVSPEPGPTFEPHATLDLTVSVGSGSEALLVQGIPVGGATGFKLISLTRPNLGQVEVERGAAEWTDSSDIGVWFRNWRRANGREFRLDIDAAVVDFSPSMRAHQDQVQAVLSLLGKLAGDGHHPLPTLAQVGSKTAGRVGAVAMDDVPAGRCVVITDLPLAGPVPVLSLSPDEVNSYLGRAGGFAFGRTRELLEVLAKEQSELGEGDAKVIDALVQWLERAFKETDR